jgi:hypothetical protein
MKRVLLFILIVSAFCYAGNQFFSSPVNFFGSTQSETKLMHSKAMKKKPVVSIWAQPIVMPNGTIQVYVPPPQVVNFLNNPTPQNAQAYFNWEKERIAKIAKASAMLQQIAEKNNTSNIMPVNSQTTIPQSQQQIQPQQATQNNNTYKSPFSTPTILYFAKQGCKFCMAEEFVMHLFYKEYHNYVHIIGLWVGSKNSIPKQHFPFQVSNGLEKKFKIGLYPAMIFYLPNKPEPVKLEGFVTGNQLIQFYQKIGGKL